MDADEEWLADRLNSENDPDEADRAGIDFLEEEAASEALYIEAHPW